MTALKLRDVYENVIRVIRVSDKWAMTGPDDQTPYLIQKVVALLLPFVVSNEFLVAVEVGFWLEELVCNESIKLRWMGNGSKQDVQHDGDWLTVNERGLWPMDWTGCIFTKDVTIKLF
jgi:hypothetical protein